MPAQGRGGRPRWALVLFAAIAATGVAAGQDREEIRRRQREEPAFAPMTSETMRSDAELNDVCFVTPELGWAVGDRGTVWNTRDGGRQWSLQESGVSCRLESVCFVNTEIGWAAGWTADPYLHTGSGVLLWTHDGGKHWNRGAKAILPALKRVRFINPRNGWAIGCPSALYPSGVLLSDSAGRNWNPVMGDKSPGWNAGDFLGTEAAAVAGPNGVAATVRNGQMTAATVPRTGLRSASRLRFFGPRNGWLVGQGGMLLASQDEGQSWQQSFESVPEALAKHFDFAAVEVRGQKCWIAGSPGTRLFHSPDGGRQWYGAATGQSLPLNALSFVDEQKGWAVGQLGTILSTSDGGQNWKVQRAGGKRAALLGIFGDATSVPLELFAKLSGNDGYLGAVELVNRRDLNGPPRSEVRASDRAHDALVRVGASSAHTAWQFPLDPRGADLTEAKTIEIWNDLHEGQGRVALESHLVRQIRMWRPEVLVTEEASTSAANPLGRLLNEMVMKAVTLAADPAAYADQIQQAGLEPWRVRRVYAALTPGVQGTTNLAAGQLAERLARSLDDLAFDARGLLDERLEFAPTSLGFQILLDNSAGRTSGASSSGQAAFSTPSARNKPDHDDFFAGIALSPGGDARRTILEPGAETLDLVRRITQKRRSIQAIIEHTQRDPRGATGLLAQIGSLTGGMNQESAGDVLYHLAQRYYQTGQWESAAEAFELLVQRCPEHPLARSASAWLIAYYSSGEAASRTRPLRRVIGQQPIFISSQSSSGANGRLDKAASLGSQLQQMRPDLHAQPSIGFSLAAADRKRGQPREAERFYEARTRCASHDVWWNCSQGEKWLAEPRGQPPKPLLRCVASAEKPRLDGRLDDPIWEKAARAELHSPARDDAAWPTEVLLARDDQFLYLAVLARQAPGVSYETPRGTRPRDADLTSRDRVELLVDIDRDYTTCYRMAVDHRGWTAEDCWGDATWDPKWFVAAASGQGQWAVEAAIPLEQLADGALQPGTTWAIGLQRLVPGVGFQSWSMPAAPEAVPEGFGYLLFE